MDYCVRDVMTMHRPGEDMPETLLDVARAIAQTAMFTLPIAGADTGLKGTVGALDIVVALGRGKDPATTPVDEFAREVITIEPGASLETARDLLPEHQGSAVVVDDGEVIGIVDLAQIELFMESVSALGPDAGRLITEVSPRDTFGAHFSRGSTVAAGVSALECIRDALDAVGKDGVSSLLDFPSGHGRILRVLKAAFPDARLAAGELDRDAVDFCAQTFGAAPIYSATSPEDVTIDDTYDLIWCGSLLTHIGPDRWPGFLSLFRDCLTPDGVLVFTTCGPRLRHRMILRRFNLQEDQADRVLSEYDEHGVGYSDYPGSENYGITLASPDWAREQLQAVGLRLVSHVEAGWTAPAPRQDVIACVRE